MLKKKIDDHFLKVHKMANWAPSSLCSHFVSVWSQQLWMLVSKLQNKTQRLKTKPLSLSDAASRTTGQLKWLLCPLRSCFLFSTPFYSIVSLSSRRGLSCCTVDSHWVEPWKEEICRHKANHISMYLQCPSEEQLKGINWVKNSLSTSEPYWVISPLWIRQKQNHRIRLTIS